jgi:hypothetical protein
MRANVSHGEDVPVNDSGNIEEVQRRLQEIQRLKRGRMRWNMSEHTAEMALVALDVDAPLPARKSGKRRQRKRHKRLL